LTTTACDSEKAVLPSAFNTFAKVRQFAANPAKTRKALKTQHFIRIRLKTPGPVKIYAQNYLQAPAE
jgi:hypothetical protein